MEYLIRPARITDIERLVALAGGPVRASAGAGTMDSVVVDPDHDADRVTDALLEEILRSARNKGCTLVEAALPEDPAERTRLERHGFVESGPRAECRVAAVGVAGTRNN